MERVHPSRRDLDRAQLYNETAPQAVRARRGAAGGGGRVVLSLAMESFAENLTSVMGGLLSKSQEIHKVELELYLTVKT